MNNIRRKGQSAIEYLMNYAWAIALIIIVGAAIYGLNIGGIRTSLSGQGTQLQATTSSVSVTGYQLQWTGTTLGNGGNNSTLSMAFQNNGANRIVFNNANITTLDGSSIVMSRACIPSTTTMYPGDTITNCAIVFNTSLAKAAGQPYTVKIVTNYTDNTSGIVYTPSHTLTGTVV